MRPPTSTRAAFPTSCLLAVLLLVAACASPAPTPSPSPSPAPSPSLTPSVPPVSVVPPAGSAAPPSAVPPARPAVAALSAAEVAELLGRPPAPVGRLILAAIRLAPTGFRCPPDSPCPAYLIAGLQPAMTVRVIAGTQVPASGTFALRVVSASTLDMVGVVTPGPRALWWTAREALRAPAGLIVVVAWLGVNRRPLPCPSVPGTPDPWSGGYGCGHAEWLADSPALPSEQEFRPPGSLAVRNGAWDAFAPPPAPAQDVLPEPEMGTWLVAVCRDGSGPCPAATVRPAGAIVGRIDPT